MRRIRDPKSVRLKDRDYDVTPNIIAHMYPQIRNGSVKECEVEMLYAVAVYTCRCRGLLCRCRWRRPYLLSDEYLYPFLSLPR